MFSGLCEIMVEKAFDAVLIVPSVAERSKTPESDANAGGESPVRARVRAATLCPYA